MSKTTRTIKMTGALLEAALAVKACDDAFQEKKEEIEKRAQFELDGLATYTQEKHIETWSDIHNLAGLEPTGSYELDFSYQEEHGDVFLRVVEQDERPSIVDMMQGLADGQGAMGRMGFDED